jgi:N-acetylmuramoyl-L-alanine amidase
MNIIEDLLTINEYSRPGRKLKEVKGIVLHWTGNPGASAKANRDFFESRKTGAQGYGSAHYIIDLDGSIIRDIPDDEVAYHCGSSQVDPASGKIYTDLARKFFGDYCLNPSGNSPNNASIGIEMCPLDALGHFTVETWKATEQLVVQLLKQFNLGVDRITTHEQVVGWKSCPLLFHNHPEELTRFVTEVQALMV